MPNAGNFHRVIALVGPQSSGKTALLEALLRQTGKLGARPQNGGRVFGDTSAEAKAREMGTEINVARTTFMGDTYSFIDCPGAIELMQESKNALAGVDAAVIVTESDTDKFVSLSPILHYLDEIKCPRYIFVNKVDKASGSVQKLVTDLSLAVKQKLALRHLPLRQDDQITGYADLASERVYTYQDDGPSTVTDLPQEDDDRMSQARYGLLETLADFDDHLMEELLEDVTPPKDEVYRDLAMEVQEGLIIPVMLGSALHQNGVHRLLKALRHEVPSVEKHIARLGATDRTEPVLGQVIKTIQTSHAGKLSLVRLLKGSVKDGDTINGERVSGVFHLHGDKYEKCALGEAGDLVGLGHLDSVVTGDTIVSGKGASDPLPKPDIAPPVFNVAVNVADRSDEVKLSQALRKIVDEDPAIAVVHAQDTNQTLLQGQGEIHLQITLDRLTNRYGMHITTEAPMIPYKETIRKGTSHHSRYKKQSGGHGQFGDVVVKIAPLPLGSGFNFEQTITGGAIPKQYIPSVEAGVREYLNRGPLGFQVVDVGVTLTDGSFHAVDSSDMAFKTAGRLAMSEAMPECHPVLLEPVMKVSVMVPSEHTAKINGLISSRRGQILGFDARQGWPGWDEVQAFLPQSEMQDMIIEIRSMTAGAGTYINEFDHLSELSGRLADQVLTSQQAAE